MAAVEFFDVIVVGSGFGGSVATGRLAEAGKSVCLLERGKAYPPGSFARSPNEMSKNFWDPSEGLQGLYDVWSFSRIDALVSSGLGGGSLIYANVLLRKDPTWFVEQKPDGTDWPWPVSRADLDPHYDRVEQVMNVQRFPLGEPGYEDVKKTAQMNSAAKAANLHWARPPLAVTFANNGQPPRPGDVIEEDQPNLHGRPRLTCLLCGECDIGCNYGSKNTLDYTYLSRAKRNGADIRTRSEVRNFGSLGPDGKGFWVEYVRHDDDSGRPRNTGQAPLIRVECKRLILSAGSLGSTFLMLKNREHCPEITGTALGKQFCGNGDLLGFFLPRAGSPELNPSKGPVITSFSRSPDELDGGEGRGFYIEDGGYPVALDWLVENLRWWSTLRRGWIFAKTVVQRRLFNRRFDANLSTEVRDLLGRNSYSARSLAVLGMGRDMPNGNLSLDDKGRLQNDWDMRSSRRYFKRLKAAMKRMAKGVGAKFKPNPTYLFGRVVTVHPLGGCPMGHNPGDGFVDSYGEVFGQKGLYVADGSVMPGPVGPNPALTIAALADRTADRILETWGDDDG